MRERFHAHGRPSLAFARKLAAACFLLAPFVPVQAFGYYEEAHVIGDEVKVTVDTAGSARVEHEVTWHVIAGQFHALDLPGVDAPVQPEPEATLTGEDGRIVEAVLGARDDHDLRVAFSDPKGIHHGQYKIRLAYRVDLVATHAMVRDGAMWRLTWQGPTWPEGYDGARVMFELPPALDEPRCAGPDDGAAEGTLCTLRRDPAKDELELVKPHVARREVVAWSVRVAPRAFPGIHDATLRPPPLPSIEPQRRTLPRLLFFAGLLAIAMVYGSAVRRKALRFDEACRAYGARARGLAPGPLWLRATLGGAGLAAGVLAEAMRAPTWGGVCVALAMAMACLRPPRARTPVRGPGRWLALRPGDAFAPRASSDLFDPLSWRGGAAAILALSLLAGLGFLLRPLSAEAPYFAALDALAWLPLVATGRRSQLPHDGRSGGPWLKRIFARLSKERALRVAPFARVPVGRVEPDEVRILALPRAGMPGLVGIEVGLAWRSSATSYVASPAVIVRVHESTAASARMTALAPFARPVPGRKPEERAYRLVPRFPTRNGTLALVRRLGKELVDRRLTAQSWEQEERRLPPASREKAIPRAA
jgi:hypothetical protein